MSDCNSERHDGDVSTSRKVGKRSYKQNYSTSWEKEAAFKGWLTRSDRSLSQYYCKCCKVHGTAGKSEITKHSRTSKHLLNVKSVVNQQTLIDMSKFSSTNKLEDQVKAAEIKMCAYLTEHNLPFIAMDHLSKLIGAVCPDSEIGKKLACGKTKSSAVIKNVIGEESKEQLICHLRKNVFSLICDESTDRGCIKHLSLVVRTINNTFQVHDAFLTLIPLEGATADILYASITEFFKENKIPYETNMIGYAADGANVMMGGNHSLATKFTVDIPDLFVFKCICHSFHLCASYACLKLPRFIEDLARDVHNYFHCSPKRLGEYAEFQKYLDLKPHKLLQPCQTRWLSLSAVVVRLLQQLSALKLFFTKAALGDRVLAADNILQMLNNPLTKLYLEFLEYSLSIFVQLNLEMQSEKPKIHLLFSRVSCLYRQILDCYIKPEYLKSTPLTKVQFRDPSIFASLNDVYLGGKVASSLLSKELNLRKEEKDQFIIRCRDFYIEGVAQIHKRFPLDKYEYLKGLNFIDPSIVKKKDIASIVPLAVSFPNLVEHQEMTSIDNEWRLLRNIETLPISNEICEFWHEVSKLHKGDDTPMFPILTEFVKKVLCLPHSSAAVERVFSQINLLKTKQRNRLKTSTLIGILHAKRKLRNINCYSFNVEDSYLVRFNKKMYDFNLAK